MRPAYYDCPSCHFFHARGIVNPCDDDAQCFEPEQLDELYPDGGWDEIKVEKPNLARLQVLTPHRDLNGNDIMVGCRVRVYSFFLYQPETDELSGIDGDLSYSEGRLEDMVEVDGRLCYKIVIDSATDIKNGQAKNTPYTRIAHIGVNGSESGLGWPMFGVFRVLG